MVTIIIPDWLVYLALVALAVSIALQAIDIYYKRLLAKLQRQK